MRRGGRRVEQRQGGEFGGYCSFTVYKIHFNCKVMVFHCKYYKILPHKGEMTINTSVNVLVDEGKVDSSGSNYILFLLW